MGFSFSFGSKLCVVDLDSMTISSLGGVFVSATVSHSAIRHDHDVSLLMLQEMHDRK